MGGWVGVAGGARQPACPPAPAGLPGPLPPSSYLPPIFPPLPQFIMKLFQQRAVYAKEKNTGIEHFVSPAQARTIGRLVGGWADG